MSGNKPFFSRSQLNIIIVVVTLAILVLSTSGSKVQYPELHRSDIADVPLYWTPSPDGNPSIRLSFALPEDSPEAVRHLVYEQLRQRLLQPPRPFGSATPIARDIPDRFVVGLKADSAGDLASALQRLISTLAASSGTEDWQQRWLRLKASRYLSGQASAIGDDTTVATAARQLDQQLFSRRHLSLSLLGDAEALRPAITQALTQLPPGSPWPEPVRLDPPQTLRLPGRQSTDFAATFLGVRLLQQRAEQQGLTLHWLPLADRSELSLDAEFSLFTALIDSLRGLDSDTLDAAKATLLEQFSQRLQEQDAMADQLESIAFYRLPLDYLPDFAAKIEAQTPATLSALLDRWPIH